MKNPERVAELLAELRALAETDFERHRLDVLEKDLHEPPKVEQIDETHQHFLGFEFTKKAKGYFTREMRIHRLVWQYYHGDVPQDYHVHHVDENESNNDAANLQLLSPSQHNRIHHSEEKPQRFTCIQCGKEYTARFTGRNKFCSQQCLADYHNKQRNQTCRAARPQTFICVQCGKEYTARFTGRNKFCSRKCLNNYYNKRRKTKNQTP